MAVGNRLYKPVAEDVPTVADRDRVTNARPVESRPLGLDGRGRQHSLYPDAFDRYEEREGLGVFGLGPVEVLFGENGYVSSTVADNGIVGPKVAPEANTRNANDRAATSQIFEQGR